MSEAIGEHAQNELFPPYDGRA